MIYFNSGGFCGAGSLNDTLESCYKRSFGDLGSTKGISQTMTGVGKGILSPL